MFSNEFTIYYCPFDGKRCRVFTALHRRKGLYVAVGCVIDKHYKNFHKCPRYCPDIINKRDEHHCPFDGGFCKNVRGCHDAFCFSNEMPIPKNCPRAKIKLWR